MPVVRVALDAGARQLDVLECLVSGVSWPGVITVGDCVEVMAGMEPGSVDAVVCDPPYGIEFMGRDWDRLDGVESFEAKEATASGKQTAEWGERDSPYARRATPSYFAKGLGSQAEAMRRMQTWHERWAREALRVLKPGGFLVAAGGTRTFHRLVCALEDAGFEIRDCIACWVYGSGFPKSLNVSEALRDLPRCSCEVGGEPGIVDAALPPGDVRATVGAEAIAVSAAGLAADGARGLGAQPSAKARRREERVGGGGEHADGQLDPVVLGPSGMALATEGNEVGEDVRRVEVEPEPLRDEMVRDESVSRAAVEAASVAGDHSVGYDAPSVPLVLPLAAAPGGVAVAGEPEPVVGSHASARAVGSGSSASELVGDERLDAGSTDEGRHPLKCPTCGGVRGEIIDGFGTALKPSFEPWTIARKPLGERNVASNVLRYGTGAINVDATRIGYVTDERVQTEWPNRTTANSPHPMGSDEVLREYDASKGRWPANVILVHAEGCVEVGTKQVLSNAQEGGPAPETALYGAGLGKVRGAGYGLETVAAWECVDGCPVRELDEQTGELARGTLHSRGTGLGYHGADGERGVAGVADAGGASRFFYCAKASRAEREAGLDGAGGEVANKHPTVKPVEVMRWLVRLVTPPGGTVLDPFAGSGTTGIACGLDDFEFVGVEQDESYVRIAEARIAFWRDHGDEAMEMVRREREGVRRQAAVAESGQESLW